MRVLAVKETNPYIKSNATNNRFLSLSEGLSEKGVLFDLVFLSGFSSVNEKKIFEKKGVYKGFKYVYLLPFLFTNFFVRQFFYKIFPIKFLFNFLEKKIDVNDYDFIWIGYDPKSIQLGLRIMKKYKSAKFFHERSEFSWIGLSQFKRLHKKYLYTFLPKINFLAVMTLTLKEYYDKFTAESCLTLHLPMTVDFSRFQDSSNFSNKKYIAYCGTMNNKKDGVDILIKSFINIANDYPELNLFIAGPLKPEKDYLELKKIVEENNIEQRVNFLGEMSKEQIPNFLLGAKILAMARPRSKQAEGGFPTKLGEYLASGNPVCVTNVGEITNYLTNNKSAYISEPDSVLSFQSILLRALNDVDSQKVGISGRNIALKRFNKDIQVNKLHNFFANNLV